MACALLDSMTSLWVTSSIHYTPKNQQLGRWAAKALCAGHDVGSETSVLYARGASELQRVLDLLPLPAALLLFCGRAFSESAMRPHVPYWPKGL